MGSAQYTLDQIEKIAVRLRALPAGHMSRILCPRSALLRLESGLKKDVHLG
jgi:hypothetical protein